MFTFRGIYNGTYSRFRVVELHKRAIGVHRLVASGGTYCRFRRQPCGGQPSTWCFEPKKLRKGKNNVTTKSKQNRIRSDSDRRLLQV